MPPLCTLPLKNPLQQEIVEPAKHVATLKTEIHDQKGVKIKVEHKGVKVKEEKDLGKPICTVDLNTMTCKRLNDGMVVPLTAGPSQVMVADFGSYVHSTELSNLMLQSLPQPSKKKKKKETCKKPAAAQPPPDDPPAAIAPAMAPAPPAAIHPALPAQERDGFRPEWYKGNLSIGIRAKFGSRGNVFLLVGGHAKSRKLR